MATVTQNIVDELRSDILAGKYNARARFLSEAQIMRRFGVARQTAVRALERLAQDGLVYRKKGSGTFITDSARNRTGMIGLIVPGLAYAEIFAPICSALSRLCSQKGYTLHLADFASEDPVERARLAEMVASDFAQRHVAGVIFQPVEFLAESDVPFTRANIFHAEPTDRAKVAALMKGARRPQAIVCGNDTAALRLKMTLEGLGYHVPADMLLAGFDDFQHARMASLTTCRQPLSKIAAACMDMLLSRMDHPGDAPRESRLHADFVARESTDFARFAKRP